MMSDGPLCVPDNLAEALEHLEADGLVAFPTETVWGLAARASSPHALERLRSFKGRDRDRPISVLIDNPSTLESLGISPDARLMALARAFWPGPLTLVVRGPGGRCLAPGIGGPNGTVGFRCSDHPLASLLVREAIGRGLGPLTATSFNRSGETPVDLHSAAILLAKSQTREQVLVLRAGPHDASGGLPSTVLDLSMKEPRVLREGAIGERELARVLADIC